MKMKMKRLLGLLLSLTLVLGMLPGMSLTAYADGEPSVTASPADSGTISIVRSSLYASDKVPGTGAIPAPGAPTDAGWNGGYVYYGKYDGSNPTKYRVLDKDATEFGGNTMFLDCDSILYYDSFNKNNDSGNVWAGSNVKTGLNGEKFLEKSDNFSDIEKAAIALSTVSEHDLVKADNKNKNEEGKVAPWIYNAFGKYVPLNEDKVFLLDVEDVSNIKYGYRMTDSNGPERLKKDQKGEIFIWFLRSANTDLNYCVGCCMHKDGYTNGDLNRNDVCFELGVSPAFNVDLGSVIFTSLIPETSNEYKLTLLDNNIKITTANCSKSGNTVTVSYTLAGDNAANVTRISALITDKPYSPGTDMTDGYAYEKLDVKTAGTGTFTIPDSFKDKEWGKDYHVYILAEDENEGKETDYASAPVELYSVLTAPEAKTGLIYNGDKKNLVSPGKAEGGTMKYALGTDATTTPTEGWSTSIPQGTDAGTYHVWYMVSGDVNHDSRTGATPVDVTIAPATLTGVSVTQSGTLTYTGNAQTPEVTTAATAVNAQTVTFTYSKTSGGTYGTMPSVTNVSDCGTIYYKASAPNHSDATGSFTVTMNKATQTITANDVTATYGDTNKSVSATVTEPATGGGEISYAVKDGSGDYIEVNASTGVLTITKVPASGNAYVTVTAEEVANYKTASMDVTVTVSPKTVESPTITVAAGPYIYSRKAHEPAVTVKDGETEIDGSEYTVSYSNNVNPGEATVTITDNTGGNYTVSGSTSFTIAPWADNATQTGKTSTNTTNDTAGSHTETKAVFTEPWDGGEIIASVDITINTVSSDLTGIVTTSFDTTVGVSVDIQHNAKYHYTSYTLSLDVTLPKGLKADGKLLYENVSLESKDFTLKLTGTPTVVEDTAVKLAATVTVAGCRPVLVVSADKTVPLTINKLELTITTEPTAKTDLTANGTAQELVAAGTADGGTMQYVIGTNGDTPPTEGWDTSIPKATEPGTYYVWYRAVGDTTHSDSKPKVLTVIINEKKVAVVTEAPTSNDLTYTGSAQELVAKGTTDGGTMKYGLTTGDQTAQPSNWDTSIPTGTDAGIYHVWYMVSGDEKHQDTLPASLDVTIKQVDAPDYEVPTGLTASYGDTLADVKLPAGWKWDDPETTSVGNVGENIFKATFTPQNKNYKTVKSVSVTVTVKTKDKVLIGEDQNADAQTITEYLGNTSTTELKKITDAEIKDAPNIESLSGIKEMENLETLTINDANKLTDISELKELKNLKTLNVNNCSSLEKAELNGNTTLQDVSMNNCEALKELDVSNCPELTSLDCSASEIELLKMDSCPNLVFVDCSLNSLGYLDMPKDDFPKLVSLDCHGQTKDGLEPVESNGRWVVPLAAFTTPQPELEAGNVKLASVSNVILDSVQGYKRVGLDDVKIETTCSSAGIVSFASRPEWMVYDYNTGFENVSMDVTVMGTEKKDGGSGSSSSGCGSDPWWVLLLAPLPFLF